MDFSALLFLGAGIILTVGSGFYPIRAAGFIFRNTAGTLLKKGPAAAEGKLTPFMAVTTALAGTMGVGNIAGVATAIVAGGPGAVLWMCAGAFFGMMSKYAEIFLAVKYRRREQGRYCGGPMYYMERGLKNKPMARAFAFMCAVSAGTACNITQTNSVSTAMLSEFGVPLWFSGAVMTLCVALVVVGGIKRIGRVTELVIPFISVMYICVSLAFLFINREQIPGALGLILREATGLKPAAGGAAGYGISRALRFGLARGVFTNEAGLGSAPIVHAGADCKSPAHQAVWGIFEVFLDTIVVCTLTALVLLTAGDGRLWQAGQDGAPLTAAAFSSVFGGFGGRFIALSILFFAVSAVLSWYF
jgi:AGCS family alanine or glycine:cation symporter